MSKSGSSFPRLGERWSRALTARYPKAARKLIARTFGVTERSASNWLAGQPPSLEHFLLITGRLDPSFLLEVLGGEVSWAELIEAQVRTDQLRDNISQLREQLERLGTSLEPEGTASRSAE